MALRNVVWSLRDVNLARIELTEEDEIGGGPVPPLPSGMTVEEYLTTPLNLETDANGQVVLVFPGVKLLKAVQTNRRTGLTDRITTLLEVVYEQDQLPDGLHVLGGLADLYQTDVSLEILQKFVNAESDHPETTYEDLVRVGGFLPWQNLTLKYKDLLKGTFYGLTQDYQGRPLPPGQYKVLLG